LKVKPSGKMVAPQLDDREYTKVAIIGTSINPTIP
jgi:hypothetical protein